MLPKVRKEQDDLTGTFFTRAALWEKIFKGRGKARVGEVVYGDDGVI